MRRVSLFGSGVYSDSAVITRQRRLNCFFEIRKDGDKEQLVARGTPGIETAFILPAYPIRGWHVVSNVLYVVAGLSLCKVLTDLTSTIVGTFAATSTGTVSMADNGVHLIIADGVAGYVYTLVTGSYAQSSLNAAGSFGVLTDANFPNGTNSLCFLDARIVAAKAGTRQHYSSESYDATDWTNVDSLPTFGTKDNNSDLLLAVTAANGILSLLGQQSIEFWQNVGTSPLIFGRVAGATRNHGLAAQYSIARIGEHQLFLGQDFYGGLPQVTMLTNFTMQRVSTNDIEHEIAALSLFTDAVGFGYMIDGHKMYEIVFPSADKSLLYDITTDLWCETQSGTALTGRHIVNKTITFNSVNYAADATTANVYKIDDEIYTDNGNPIKRQLTTRHIHRNGNRFGIDELYLDMETGVGLQTGQGSDPQIMLQVSKDNGRTFGPERWKPIGKVGQYKSPRVMWNRLGASQDFVFQFTCTDPIKFTVIGGSVKIREQEGVQG